MNNDFSNLTTANPADRNVRTPRLLACLSLACCALFTAPALAETAARVGDREVTVEQLEALLPDLTPAEKLAFTTNPETFNQYVRSLLIRQMVHNSAVENEWDLNPVAQEAMERASQAALVESYLQAVASVPEDFPSDEQLTAFYEANRASFTSPEQYNLSQVFFAVTDDADAETVRAEAEQVRANLAAGDIDFAEAAQRFSDEDATARNGGRVGWVAMDNLQPDLRSVVSAMEPGTLSEVVRLPGGFHIVRLEEIRDAFTVPFADVRDRLAAQLRARRAQANREAFLERLIQENPVALNELVLSRLLEEETGR